MIRSLYDWMISWAQTDSAELALFVIAFAESSFFPLPPDILLMAMNMSLPEKSFFFALLCSVASVLGGVFGYSLGFYGGRPILDRFISQKKLEKVEILFNRYDAWAIGIAGFTPIPYKVFTLASGAFKINFKVFLLTSIISRSARFFILAVLFYFWGATIKILIDEYFNLFSLAFVILLLLGFWIIKKVK